MKYLLDTSTLICILRRRRNEHISARLKSLEPGEAAISTIVRLELLEGAYRQQDPGRAAAELSSYLAGFPSLPVDDAVAARGGELRAQLAAAGMPIGPYDLLIAATALCYHLTVVTCNTGEFVRVPKLAVEDWQHR